MNTNKIDLIKTEVERLKLCTMDEHMKFYSEAAEAEYNALCKVEKAIDSLQEESVSDMDETDRYICNAFKAGAQWQKEQIMKDATDVTVHIDAGGYPYIPQMELYDYDNDVPLAKEGDKYKVVLIKEE